MNRRYLIQCGGAHSRQSNLAEKYYQVFSLVEENLSSSLAEELKKKCNDLGVCAEPVYLDLCETVMYISAAEQLIGIPTYRRPDFTRELEFIIPVRCLSIWQKEKVKNLLIKMVDKFYSNNHSIEFVGKTKSKSIGAECTTKNQDKSPKCFQEIIIFPGDLDAIYGVQQELQMHTSHLLLINPTASASLLISENLFDLVDLDRMACVEIDPITILDQEKNQSLKIRTTLLFLCVYAAALAAFLSKMQIQLYKDGILTFIGNFYNTNQDKLQLPNLASFAYLSELTQELQTKKLSIKYPLVYKTEKEIIAEVINQKNDKYLETALSCSQDSSSREPEHCGTCLFCIHRFIAEADTEIDTDRVHFPFETNFIINPISEADAQNRYVEYIQLFISILNSSEVDFVENYGRVFSELLFLPGKSLKSTEVFHLFKRQAQSVDRLLRKFWEAYSDKLLLGKLPENCALRLCIDSSYQGQQSAGKSDWDSLNQAKLGTVQKVVCTVDYRSVTVDNKTFTFTPKESKFVKHLLDLHKNGTDIVSIQSVLEAISSNANRIQDVFQSCKNWRELIPEIRDKRGFCKLNIDPGAHIEIN